MVMTRNRTLSQIGWRRPDWATTDCLRPGMNVIGKGACMAGASLFKGLLGRTLYMDSQVAGNKRPLHRKVDHYWFKVAHNYEALALQVAIHVYIYICIYIPFKGALELALRVVCTPDIGPEGEFGNQIWASGVGEQIWPTGSKYPIFQDSGPKCHLGYGFWDQSP